MRLVATLCAIYALASIPGRSTTVTLTFEGLKDLQEVNDFYAGVHFFHTNAQIAGGSLNTAEFPPLSGKTVALNDGDELTSITWDSPVTNFSGNFTYFNGLALEFSLGATPVGTVNGAFVSNLGLSGDPGSTPNEHLTFHGSAFDSVQVVADTAMDDISFDTPGQGAPEPATTTFVAAALPLMLIAARRYRTPRL